MNSCTYNSDLGANHESYDFYEEHKRWLEKQPAFTWKPEPQGPDSPQQWALARVERRIAEREAEINAGWNLMDACSNHGNWLD